MSLVFLVLAMCELGAVAEERKLEGARPDRIVAAHRIECSLDLKSGEPLDPPSTATIQQAEQFKAREHFKEDITPAADVKNFMAWCKLRAPVRSQGRGCRRHIAAGILVTQPFERQGHHRRIRQSP